MLTLKLLREQPEDVIKKLAVKNFDAKEIVEKINALDADRRALQTELDGCLAEQKKMASMIGSLMKEGKKEEADRRFREFCAFIRSRELEHERRLDVFRIIEVAIHYTGFTLPEGE